MIILFFLLIIYVLFPLTILLLLYNLLTFLYAKFKTKRDPMAYDDKYISSKKLKSIILGVILGVWVTCYVVIERLFSTGVLTFM